MTAIIKDTDLLREMAYHLLEGPTTSFSCGSTAFAAGSCPVETPIINVPFSSTLTPTGGQSPYVFWLVSGSLPPGVTLDPSTGQLSGTPTQIADYSWVIRAQDAVGAEVDFSCPLNVSEGEGSIATSGWIMEEDSTYVYTSSLFINTGFLRIQRIRKSDLSVTTFNTQVSDNIYGGVAIQQDSTYVYVLCRNFSTTAATILRILKADFTTYDIHEISSSDRPSSSYDAMLLDNGVLYFPVATIAAGRLKILKVDASSFSVLDTFTFDDFITYGVNVPTICTLGHDSQYLYTATNPELEGAILIRIDKTNFAGGITTLFSNDGATNLGIAGGNEIIVDGDSIYLGLTFGGSPLQPRLGKFSISGGTMTALELGSYTPTTLTSLANRRRLQGGLLLAVINYFNESGNPPVMIEIDPTTFTVSNTQNLTVIAASATRDFVLNGSLFYVLQCSDYTTQGVNSTLYKIIKT